MLSWQSEATSWKVQRAGLRGGPEPHHVRVLGTFGLHGRRAKGFSVPIRLKVTPSSRSISDHQPGSLPEAMKSTPRSILS